MVPEIIEVTAAIIQRDDRILIAQRPASSWLAGKWEFPGGQIEAGEDGSICFIRELREELGITVVVGAPFSTVLHDYGEHGRIRLHSFLCRIVAGEPTALYHADLQWAAPEELPNYDFAPADIPIVERLISQRGEAT